nr:hypothetical protein [Tanacetum cinerariifolium]
MSVRPIWKKKLNPSNTSNEFNVNSPTPMSKPLTPHHEPSQENNHPNQALPNPYIKDTPHHHKSWRNIYDIIKKGIGWLRRGCVIKGGVSLDDVCLVDEVFDGEFGGDGEEDFVMREDVVVSSSSLDRSTKSCLGGIMVSLIFLKGLKEEACVDAMEVEEK